MTGFKFMGKDPGNLAKPIKVGEDGTVHAQLTGSSVEETNILRTNPIRMAYQTTELQKLTLPFHGQGIHPSVVYIQPPGLGGYSWWMVYTPYENMNARDENPTILASQDGLNWVEPPGISNPIHPDPGAPRFNRDPELIYDGTQLICYWVDADPDGAGQTYRRTSADGVTWSAAEAVTPEFGAFAMSRLAANNWLVWDSTTFPRLVTRWRSNNGVTFWQETSGRSNMDGPSLHLSVYTDAEGYHFLTSPYRQGGSNNYDHGIYYGFSPDGDNIVFDSTPLVMPQIDVADSWYRDIIYRSCMVRISGGRYRVYVSAIGNGKPHIGVMEIRINPGAWRNMPFSGKSPWDRKSVRLVNNGEVRNTSVNYINLGQIGVSEQASRITDWFAYEHHAFVFRNSHDQAVSIVLTTDGLVDYYSTAQTVTAISMPASQPNRPTYVDSRTLPALSGMRPMGRMSVYLLAATAPTSGNVTVDLIMWN